MTKVVALLAIANNVFSQCVVSTFFGNFTCKEALFPFLFDSSISSSPDLVKESVQGVDFTSSSPESLLLGYYPPQSGFQSRLSMADLISALDMLSVLIGRSAGCRMSSFKGGI